MEFIAAIKELIPDYAKDIRLNLDGTIARSSLQGNDAVGVALAAAFAAKSPKIIAAIREAGLPRRCKAHGLRKAAARRLAEAGCSASEIMAITGHKTLAEVERYTRAVRKKKLADAAMAKLK